MSSASAPRWSLFHVVSIFKPPESLQIRAVGSTIAAVHAEAPSAEATDWAQIVGLYDVLLRAEPSPIIELNRAAAIAMRDSPEAGLALIDTLLARGELDGYHLAHAARADLLRRLGHASEARAAYERALALVQQDPERRFLERQMARLGGGVAGGA